MKKLLFFLLLFLAISILFAIYYFSFRDKVTSVSPGSIAQNVATTTSVMPTITADWIEQNKGNTAALPPGRVESHDTHNTYINESWGFTFNFPKDWELTEPAFGSGSTLFNLALNPKTDIALPDKISFNITSKEWVDKIIIQNKIEQDRKFTDITFQGVSAIEKYGMTFSVVPTFGYFILVDDLYWIDITVVLNNDGKVIYSNEWETVRDSFQFLE